MVVKLVDSSNFTFYYCDKPVDDGVDFLPVRSYASPVFAAIACLSVRPSMRLSQRGIVSKRLNIGSQKTTPHDSPGL